MAEPLALGGLLLRRDCPTGKGGDTGVNARFSSSALGLWAQLSVANKILRAKKKAPPKIITADSRKEPERGIYAALPWKTPAIPDLRCGWKNWGLRGVKNPLLFLFFFNRVKNKSP